MSAVSGWAGPAHGGDRPGDLARRLGVPVDHGDGRPLLGEPERRRPPDASTAAGDQHGLSQIAFHHWLSQAAKPAFT
jgi:hypothetical protein